MRFNLTIALISVILALVLLGSACSDSSGEDLDQGPTIFLEDSPLAVGPDESVYAVVNVEGQHEIYRVDPDTAEPTLVLTLSNSRDIQFFFPEDRILLQHRNRGRHELQILDPETFEAQATASGNEYDESPRFSASGRHLVMSNRGFRLPPFHLIDTRTLQTVALPEEGDTSEVLWLPQGERLMMLAFYGQPTERIRVMIWDIDESIFTTSLFPDRLLDIEVEDLQFPDGLDFRWIGLSPDGTKAAIPVFGLIEGEPIPPEEADAGMSDTLDMDTEAEEADSEAQDDAEGDVTEEADASPEDVIEVDVPEEEDAESGDVEAEDIVEDEPMDDASEVEDEPSEPSPPPAMAQPNLLILDLEDGTWRVVYNATGPARFTPEGTTLLAQRRTHTVIELLRIDPSTLVPTIIPLPIDVPFLNFESVSETYATMSTDIPWFLVIADLVQGQGRSVEGPGFRRPEIIERASQDQLWFAEQGLFRLELSGGVPSQANLSFEPRHLSFLPQRDLLVVDSPNTGEIVFIDAAKGEIARRAPVIDEATPDDCLTKSGAAPIGGRWQITGDGSRDRCENPILDTNNFALDAALDIAITPSDDDARATISLNSPREGFEFSGDVLGICVNFTTIETLRTGDTVELNWSGTWSDEAQAIVGTFQGTGPEICVIEGDFSARLQ